MTKTLRRVLLASTIAAGSVLAVPAFAQSAPTPAPQSDAPAPAEEAQDVIVTGSRISNPNIQQSSPVSVISSAEIGLRQPTSIEQVLRQLPGSAPGIGQQVNNGQGGVATFNLRGLGANRNLVLLNGRRIVPSTLGNITDLNVIPPALLERTDVLTGGAVTSYGADAVTGLVNFITKSNFNGIDIQANYGITERGDGQSYRLDFTTGANFADGAGNIIVNLNYTNVRPVLQGDRDASVFSRQSTCTTAQIAAAGVCAGLAFGINQGSTTAVPATLASPLPAGVSAARFDPVTGTIDTSGPSDFNFNPLNLFQTPLDRWQIYQASRYEFVPNVEFYTEGFYARSRVVSNIAPTGTFSAQFQLPLNNQFLTPAQRLQLCAFANIANCTAAVSAGQEITAIVQRRFVETGPRVSTFTSNIFQITAGLRGKLIGNIKWDAFVQYGEANRQTTNTGTALQSRVQASLRNCPAGSPAGCVPINIFGGAGSITQAALDFVGVPTSTFINTRFADVQGVLSGDFGVTVPWASSPISFALGGEYRRYSGGQFGDLPSATPGEVLGAGGAFGTINGSYFSQEAFGELNVPIASNRPFLRDLTFEAGFRYADYSTSGGNWTYKFGGNYSPIRQLKFRGTFTQAVRAPNLGELFQPVLTGLNNLATDPCQGTLGTANATTAAICVAQLAAVGLPASRNGAIPPPIAGQVNVTGGGNPLLNPETATTYSVGLVIQPGWIFGNFTATVDWYEINVTGAITAPTVGDIVNGCFGQTNPNFLNCTLIRRNPLTGGLSGDPSTTLGIIQQTSNLGFLQTRGIDFTASYSRRFGQIGLNWTFNGNYLDRQRQQSNPASFIRECAGFYSVSCDDRLTSKWTFNLRTTVSVDVFDFSLLWRHLEPVSYEPRVLGTNTPTTTPPPAGAVGSFGSINPTTVVGAYRTIPAFNYLDFSLRMRFNKNLEFGFTIDNLLDLNPPDVGNTIGSTGFNSGNTLPSVYDPLGRRFRFSTRVTF